MVAIKLQQFQGMIPAVDDKLLPENASSWAVNTWLLDGKIAGMREPKFLYKLKNPNETRAVYRIPIDYKNTTSLIDSSWLEFPSVHTTFVRSPNTQRTDPTGYWCDGISLPMMTSRARYGHTRPGVPPEPPVVHDPLPPLKWGIPAPGQAPVVTVNTLGISAIITPRAYCYTWLSSYGEEGAPSPPSDAITNPNDTTYDLVLQTPTPFITDQRDLTHTRIYRTIVSDQNIAEFFFVDEIPFTQTTYTDTKGDEEIVLNEQLTSQTWAEPPPNLQGIISMPNGMVAGYVNNQIWFCEPYQLHAWPYKYMLGVDYPIVGLGTMGQTLIVCTNSRPYAVTGTHPDQMAQAMLPLLEPCTSQGSVVSTKEGVYYASPNGLVMVTPGASVIATAKLIVKEEWQKYLTIKRLRAAMLTDFYFAFATSDEGVFEPTAFENTAFQMKDFSGTRTGAYIDPAGGQTQFTILQNIVPTYNVQQDTWTGEVLIIRGDSVYQIDLTEGSPQGSYGWRSKLFQMKNRQNLSAVKVFYAKPFGVLPENMGTRFRCYADGVLVKERMLPASGKMFRMPTGYTADTYQFELLGNLLIENLQVATSPHELRQA